MTTINWASGVGGNFGSAAKWTGGVVPGGGDNAVITASGTYTVTENANDSVYSLSIGSGVTFNISAGLFSIGAGSSSNVQTFEATTTGRFAINSASLTNSGTIKAGDTAASSITSSSVANTGTISETGGGTLSLIASMIDNSGSSNAGKITVSGTNSIVTLSATTIISGGTLTAGTGSSFQVLDTALLNGETSAAVTLNGALTIKDSSTTSAFLGIGGSIINKGTITLENNGDGNYAELFINAGNLFSYGASGNATLSGGGKIVMQDNVAGASAKISAEDSYPGPAMLTNVNNTISGAGTIGFPNSYQIATFTVDNQAAGIINANQAHALTINVTTLTNEGLLEATAGGTLVLAGGTIANSSTGKITASGTNSMVALSANTIIWGGTLTGTSGGSFEVLDTGLLNGESSGAVTLNTGTALTVHDTSATSAFLGIGGSIINKGTITLENNGDGNYAELFINAGNLFSYGASGNATLSGGGMIVMQDNVAGASAKISAEDSYPGPAMLTNVNNTISGAGTIGFPNSYQIATFTVDNQAAGIINANQAHALDINVSTLTNEGLIEATAAGGLTVEASSLTNSGTLLAGGGNFQINVSSILDNKAAGIINANQANTLSIEVPTLTNEGLIEETGGGTLSLIGGTIANSSTGKITASGANSIVALSATAIISGGTLTGTGGGSLEVLDVALLNGDSSAVTLNTGTAVTVNESGATSGYLGIDGSIINKGTITLENNGDGNSANLFINAGILYGYNASGTVTLTGGGSIVLQDNAAGASAKIMAQDSYPGPATLTNVNNAISGAGSIGFAGSTNIAIFNVDNQAAGVINANQAHALDINVSTLTNEGLLEATASGTLSLIGGTIANSPTGQITASGTNSVIALSGQTVISGGTLTGTGGGSLEVLDVALLNGDSSAVTLNTGTAVTVNESGATSGYLGIDGSIVNKGTITLENNGDGNSANLFINAGILYGYNASGTVTLTGGGSIVLQDNAAGASAKIMAQDSYPGPATLTNVDNTISGAGSIGFAGSTNIATFNVDNQAAGVINANQAHALDINVSTLTNEGLIEVTSAGGLTIEASSFTNTGTLTANGGNIVVSAAVTGAGSATVGGSSILEFGSTSTANTTFLSGSSATLRLDNSAGFTGTITGFGASNTLDLHNFSSSGASVSYNSGTGQLTVTNASASVSYHLVMPGISSFQVIDDGFGGTSVISA